MMFFCLFVCLFFCQFSTTCYVYLMKPKNISKSCLLRIFYGSSCLSDCAFKWGRFHNIFHTIFLELSLDQMTWYSSTFAQDVRYIRHPLIILDQTINDEWTFTLPVLDYKLLLWYRPKTPIFRRIQIKESVLNKRFFLLPSHLCKVRCVHRVSKPVHTQAPIHWER